MRTAILMVGLAVAATACSGGDRSTQEVYTPSGPRQLPTNGVATVQLTPSRASLVLGGKTRLNALPVDGSGSPVSGLNISWKTSNAGVATVSDSGDIRAVGIGSANVTATVDNVAANATVVVSAVPVASVAVSLAANSIQVGGTTQATATTKDSTGAVLSDRLVSWSSSAPSVATVSSSGLVTGVSAGSVTITATSEGKSGAASATVTPAPVATVAVLLSPAAVSVGGASQATAVLQDAIGNVLTGRTISWSSTNTTVATVGSNGAVSVLAVGTTNIVATSEGVTGQAVLTVSTTAPPPPAPVATVAVSLGASSLTTGQTTQATAVTKDASGNVLTGRTIIWTSSNTAVATVTATGSVTAVGAGSANINATSEGQVGSASVTVSPVPVANVTVSLGSSSLTTGQTTQASAVTKDASGTVLTGRVIAWSSSNTAVATVNASGTVTAVTAGTANIVATSEGKTGSAALTVSAPAPVPVATVTVSLGTSALTTGQTTQATAVTRDASSNVLTGRVIAWTSSNTAVATVSGSGLVTAMSAGTATISAMSEGKTGTATLTVSAPPPPPPPGQGEPVYQPGVNTVIFGDTFEALTDKTALLTYDWTLERWLYNNPGNIEFPSPSGGHNSAKAVRIDYPVSSSYNDQGAVLEGNVNGGAAPYYVVEVWVRTKTGYPWRRIGGGQDGAGEKSLILNQGQSIPRMVLGAGLMPSGSPWGGKYNGQWPSSNIGFVFSFDGPGVGGTGTFWYVQNMNGATRDPVGYMNDGNWHHWTIKLTPGTFQNSTGGNGSIEMWVDGAKVLEYIGSDATRPEYNQVLVPLGQVVKLLDVGGPFNGGPSSTQGAQWKDYDDLRIWTP